MYAYNHRRPSGIDKEFFVQLFVEPDKDEPAVNTQRLLNKMFQEQNITFVEVCFKVYCQLLYMYCVFCVCYSILQGCYCKCLDMGKGLRVFNVSYLP